MKSFKLCFCFIFSLIAICNFNYQALAQSYSLPDSIKQDRERYLVSKLTDDDKAYLEKLKPELERMAKLNEASASYWGCFPDVKDAIDLIESNFNKAKAIALNYLFGGGQTAENVAQDMGDFITESLPESGSGAFVGAAGEGVLFAGEIINLMQFLQMSLEISDSLTNTANGTMTWSSFSIELMEMKPTPSGTLVSAEDNFDSAAKYYCTPLGVNKLKYTLETVANVSERDIKDMERLYNSYTGGKDNWCKALLDKLLSLTIEQLKVDRDFAAGVLARVAQMDVPPEPKLPTLVATSAEIILPQGKKLENLRIGDEITVSAEIKNTGDLTARMCVAGLQFGEDESDCNRRVPLEQPLPDLSVGQTYKIEWKQTVRYYSTNIFTVLAKREGETWEQIPTYERKTTGITLARAPELSVEFLEIPERVIANQKAQIKVRVLNMGNIYSHMPVVTLSAPGETIGEITCNDVERNKPVDLTFQWTPKKKGNYTLVCEVTAGVLDQPDLDRKNNSISADVEVFLPMHAWEIVEDSLSINPPRPKVGETVNVYFNVINNGSDTNINANVFVDGENIKQMVLRVPPETEQRIGATSADAITWEVRGGSHKFAVFLDPMKTPQASIEKTFSFATLMPGVEGIDLVLDTTVKGGRGSNLTAKIYNRGNQTASNVSFDIMEYPSYAKEPISRLSKTFAQIKSHEQKVVEVEQGLGNNCKILVSVDKDNKIAEVDEKNNSKELHFGSYHPYEPPRDIRSENPDLIVANVVNLDRPMDMNENRTVTISIANPNLVEAKDVNVEYEFWNLALNDITPSHGYMKGSKILSSVPKEGDVSFAVDYKAVYPADYKLHIWVDPEAKITETDEYNNQLDQYFSVTGEVTSEIYFSGKNVDLAIDKEIKVSNPKPPTGVPVNFKVVVHNYTDIDVWGADVDMLIDGKLEAGEALGTFSANGTREFSFQHTFSSSGDYRVDFIVDAKKKVPEKDENNNIASVVIEVVPGILGTGHKDVAVTSFTLSKTSCLQGEPVTAKATFKNLGKDTLNGVTCTIGPKGTKPFYVKLLPVFDPQEEVKVFTTLPALIAGDHIVEARADGPNIIKEENEENNVMEASIHVEPITKEEVQSRATGVVAEKINNAIGAVNRWLKGLGKPKPTQ